MTRSVWIPLIAALCFELLGFVFLVPLPETLPEKIAEDTTADPHLSSDPLEREEEQRPLLDSDEMDSKKPSSLHELKESLSFLTRDTAVAALVFTFLASKVGRQSTDLLVQYVSKRYEWTIAQVRKPFEFILKC
jgi:hypothetical protein